MFILRYTNTAKILNTCHSIICLIIYKHVLHIFKTAIAIYIIFHNLYEYTCPKTAIHRYKQQRLNLVLKIKKELKWDNLQIRKNIGHSSKSKTRIFRREKGIRVPWRPFRGN